MAKSNKKKLTNKTKKQVKDIDSIPSKRVTRSNKSEILLELKKKVQHEKKSESKILRVLRSSDTSDESSKSAEKSVENGKVQPQISKRVTRSLKTKVLSSEPKPEEAKNQHCDFPRVTRSLNKIPQLSEVSNPVAPPIVRTENRIEKRVIFIKLEKFEEDTICLAKQKYSCPWPARIIRIEKDKVLVHFFGDKRVGYVQSTEIYDFTKSSEAIRSINSGKKIPRGYTAGLLEVELLLGIDISQSVLNKS